MFNVETYILLCFPRLDKIVHYIPHIILFYDLFLFLHLFKLKEAY